jgi:hypothetical protein
MLRIYILLLLFALIAACHKPDSPCLYCNNNCSHQNGDIKGYWVLEMTGGYSVPNNPGPNWKNADPNKPVDIEFKDDSLFSFNDNYFWKEHKYDRYKIIDSADFIIYSSIPFFSHPISGKIINAKEIVLTYMGVDNGTEEKYACY